MPNVVRGVPTCEGLHLPMLRRIVLEGFKSFRKLDLELRPLNVLIGANGAGKSNFISFFKLLNEAMRGRLQQHIAESGYATSILHAGPKTTEKIAAELQFETERGHYTYCMGLFRSANDGLFFSQEHLWFQLIDDSRPSALTLPGGDRESRLCDEAEPLNSTAAVVRNLLNHCRVYHFHDTSPTARVRQHCYLMDNRRFAADAGNLAAILFRFRNSEASAYRRIGDAVRLIAPYFDDFELDPKGNGKDTTLNWRAKGSDQVFGPHQLSDGTLRAMCLATLLLQPDADLPGLIVVDEPELGLHPYALNVVAGLFKMAATRTQVIVSTQSSAFLDNFEPEDVVIAQRHGAECRLSRPDPVKLAAWLEEYSLGEVWEKNVVGGGPH